MLVKYTDPQIDSVLEDGALDLVGRQRVEINVDLPGPAPEGSQHVGQRIATLGIVAAISAVVSALETVLVDAPWPVVMTVIIVLAWRLAGPRIAVFTGAALAYLALFGLWETSMVTVALLGAAAFLCVLFGIPLGIWFGKNQRAYNAAQPVLDPSWHFSRLSGTDLVSFFRWTYQI